MQENLATPSPRIATTELTGGLPSATCPETHSWDLRRREVRRDVDDGTLTSGAKLRGPSSLRYEIRQMMSSQLFRVSGIGLVVGAVAFTVHIVARSAITAAAGGDTATFAK